MEAEVRGPLSKASWRTYNNDQGFLYDSFTDLNRLEVFALT